MIAMIGTSDRLCWLAETCKILLLLLALQIDCPRFRIHMDRLNKVAAIAV